MFMRFYWFLGTGILGLYLLATLLGWEISNPVQPLVRNDVRRTPNGPVWFGGGGSHGGGFFGGK